MQKEAYFEMSRHENSHWWFKSRRMIIKKVLDHYQVEPDRRILEIGCGTGGNLELLSKYGRLHAMELDDNARSIAESKAICDVRSGFLPGSIPFDETFSLICMFDVLEHIEDDAAALNEVRKRLNSDGRFVMTVPAYNFLWSGHDVVMHHKRRYTKANLVKFVRKCGFTVRYSTYFNTCLFPIVAMTRFANRVFKKSAGSDVAMPSRFANALLTGIFSSERHFLPGMSFPFGVSILLVAENSD